MTEVDDDKQYFVLPYLGVIFVGLFHFSDEAAQTYLENLYLASDYEAMSRDIIAVSSI